MQESSTEEDEAEATILEGFSNEPNGNKNADLSQEEEKEEVKKIEIVYEADAIAEYDLGMSKMNNTHGEKDYRSAYVHLARAANKGNSHLVINS